MPDVSIDLEAMVRAAVNDALRLRPIPPSLIADNVITDLFGEQMKHHPATQGLRTAIEANTDVPTLLADRVIASLAVEQLEQDPQLRELRMLIDMIVAKI